MKPSLSTQRVILMSKRRFMTFIEVMLVLVLLLLISAVVALPVRRAVQKQRFLTETELVLQKFQQAQELMLFGPYEVEVHLATDRIWIETKDLVKDATMHAFLQRLKKPLLLKNVRFPDYEEGHCFLFQSRGVVYPKAKLVLEAADRSVRTLHFLGYPAPLRFDQTRYDLEETSRHQTDRLQGMIGPWL